MPDKILTCKQCGSQFYFTTGEQQFYKSKGLNIPRYCKSCREKKKQQKNEPMQDRTIVKACSTCHFHRGGHLYYGLCAYTNVLLDNDAPCEHWQKKMT